MKVNIDWNKFDSKHYRPLVEEEIPSFKPGTIAYDDFWDEQDDRCIKGFKPNTYMPKISGEHYFYLNMCKIELLLPGATRKTYEYPFYRELDRRLFNEISDAKKNRYSLIIGKPRRVGLSWVGSTSSTYELLFYAKNKIGIAAGQEDKALDFYEKVKELFNNIRPEYRSGILTKNDEEFKLGYSDYVNKQKVELGLQSQMFMKTMYAKPTGFEGKSLSMVIFEEAGLFEDLIASYKSTEPCFKEGSIQFGTAIIYGTGGDIEKGSKGYKEMWNAKQKTYNLKKVLVLATDYYPGDGIPDEETGKVVSFFDFRTGRTDSKMALDYILKERQEKEGSEGFVKHIQQYPLKESDIFIKNTGGLLNRKKLNAQMRNQENCPFERKKGKLEWVTNDPQTKRLVSVARSLKEIDKIHFTRGSKLKFIEDENGTINKILDPLKQKSHLPYNPDIAGCDSYDEDEPSDNPSQGGTIVYRLFHGIHQPQDLPIAYILDRGTADSDDEYYSNTFRLMVYYDTKLLVEYTKIAIINYFKDVNGEQHLYERPDLDGVGYTSKAKNQYGFKMSNQYAWELTLRLLKQEVNLNFHNYWFMEILEHLVDYGDTNADLGSALAMVMVAKLDMFPVLSEGIENSPEETSAVDDMGFWKIENGQARFTTYREESDAMNPEDPFSIHNIRGFNPEYDLEGEERRMYYEQRQKEKTAIEVERKKVLDKYGSDIMAFTVEEHNRRIKEN